MAFKRLSPAATYVTRGFGQVEPNHLSAQRTGEIYAQLPVKKSIKILENGMFAKYNYAKGVVDFEGPGEWMLVYNEVKVYRDFESDEDFAMIARDYSGSVYSPRGVANTFGTNTGAQMKTIGSELYPDGHTETYPGEDYGRNHFAIGNKYEIEQLEKPMLFGEDQGNMVPRLFKTHEGDIFTTNCIKAAAGALKLGDMLKVGSDGYLCAGTDTKFQWQVVKIYNLGDMQPAVKIMRVI